MTSTLLAISIISGIYFLISFIAGLIDEDHMINTVVGVIFVISVWSYVTPLAIIVLVFSGISFIINVLK